MLRVTYLHRCRNGIYLRVCFQDNSMRQSEDDRHQIRQLRTHRAQCLFARSLPYGGPSNQQLLRWISHGFSQSTLQRPFQLRFTRLQRCFRRHLSGRSQIFASQILVCLKNCLELREQTNKKFKDYVRNGRHMLRCNRMRVDTTVSTFATFNI